MADDRNASSSGSHRYFTRRSRKPKESEVVVLSDSSSSESNDDEVARACSTVQPSLKSAGSARTAVEHPEATPECPVCLQPCIHPARLPCGHIFCFLCLKGIAQQSRRCAMCRQEISPDYLDRPDLLQVPDTSIPKDTETFQDGYQWFYEGRNGWWQFEERISQDLEEVRQLGLDTLETLICGTLYVIDLKALVQYNKFNPTRKRRIKRDLMSNVVIKGVAGIR